MKLKSIAGILLFGTCMLTSCDDFTEIDQKGKNLLSKTSDLELLLNGGYGLSPNDMMMVSGDMLQAMEPLASVMRPTVKTKFSIINNWDETGHDDVLPSLTPNDAFYTKCYQYIGCVANPILDMVDAADGPEFDKNALRAEALVIRAYFHYLAVQKFAPAYDKSTASTTLGLAYVKNGYDIKQPTIPISLKDYYQNIISDLDAAISTGDFPDTPLNQMRFGKGSAYAIKALALMSMQEDDEAAKAAEKALAINNMIANYNDMLIDTRSEMSGAIYQTIYRPKLECVEDYFSDYSQAFYQTFLMDDMLEPGHRLSTNFYTLDTYYGGLMDASMIILDTPGYRITFDLNSSWPMIGLHTTQMYLILAENAINNNLYDKAMDYLDLIRVNRIAPDMYAPLKGSVSDKATAILKLKMTAHGEGVMSIWNFINRKRWTRLDDYKETFTRTICDINMSLTPDSKMWVFPIPQNVINNNPNFTPYLN